MHELVAWSGVVGARRLVAGPLSLAVVGQGEQEGRHHGLDRVAQRVGARTPLSPSSPCAADPPPRVRRSQRTLDGRPDQAAGAAA